MFVMSRVDDVINIAAHRLSTGQMEEVLNNHPAVIESSVIGKKDDIKGEVPLLSSFSPTIHLPRSSSLKS